MRSVITQKSWNMLLSRSAIWITFNLWAVHGITYQELSLDTICLFACLWSSLVIVYSTHTSALASRSILAQTIKDYFSNFVKTHCQPLHFCNTIFISFWKSIQLERNYYFFENSWWKTTIFSCNNWYTI